MENISTTFANLGITLEKIICHILPATIHYYLVLIFAYVQG